VRFGCWWGLSIASMVLSLSLPSLVFLSSPVVLFASLFLISCMLHSARPPPYKGPHVECALAIGPVSSAGKGGRGGVRLGLTGANICSSLLASPKVAEYDRTGGQFSGPGRFVARNHIQRWDECAPTMSTPFLHNAEIVIATRVPSGGFSCLAFAGWLGCLLSKRPDRKDQDLGLISTRNSTRASGPGPLLVFHCWVARQADRACLASRSAKIRDRTAGPRQQAVQSRAGASRAFLVSQYQPSKPSLSRETEAREVALTRGSGSLGRESPWRCDQPTIGNSAEIQAHHPEKHRVQTRD